MPVKLLLNREPGHRRLDHVVVVRNLGARDGMGEYLSLVVAEKEASKADSAAVSTKLTLAAKTDLEIFSRHASSAASWGKRIERRASLRIRDCFSFCFSLFSTISQSMRTLSRSFRTRTRY